MEETSLVAWQTLHERYTMAKKKPSTIQALKPTLSANIGLWSEETHCFKQNWLSNNKAAHKIFTCIKMWFFSWFFEGTKNCKKKREVFKLFLYF